ncbi:polysaccharide pyruvyl transferase family protein [Microbacterium paludicola]|uniref:polysaccharide pyruvyl transferase family protein n=1 Tax=Microbacterium paludicola TaxID=300019 RepID=UPI0011A57EEB|nr:polysaccharide pyruvyl transferase family protein [Microbacterium paludicola]
MKCVILGDIGWQYLYHLGDEAMTEAAIDLLVERGVEQITLVAAQPAVAEEFYGHPAVKRFGFSSKWSREKLERELDSVSLRLLDDESPLHQAVRAADAVLIAGGGNMNSEHAYHLYERVALKRLAEQHGKPLFVTSQTIGPMLRPRDRELAAEIIDYATCFGAREETSYQLALELGGVPGRVVRTMDDAMMLKARDEDRRHVGHMGLSERYIVASFTSHRGTSGLSEEEYIEKIANTLDALAVRFDADVALVPHTGSLDLSVRKGDQLSNAEVAAASSSRRLKPLEMQTARQAVALTEGAILSVSTRYHPTVFGPAGRTPTASISTSYYSSVRMRGSMSNVGLKGFVVPATSWQLAEPAFAEIVDRADDYRRHIEAVSTQRNAEQSTWWDAIVASARGAAWEGGTDLREVSNFEPAGAWAEEVEHVTGVFDLFGREKVWSKWFAEDRAVAQERVAVLEERVTSLEASLERSRAASRQLEARAVAAENRRVVRLVDRLGRLALPFTRK